MSDAPPGDPGAGPPPGRGVSVGVDPTAVVLGRFGLFEAIDPIRGWLVRARWFGGKQHRVERIEVDDLGVIRDASPTLLYTLWRVAYADADPEVYSLLVGVRSGPHPGAELRADHVVTTLATPEGSLVVYDALADPESAAELWRMLAAGASIPTLRGRLVAGALTAVDAESPEPPRLLEVQQSNSALVRGQGDFLKWSRRIEPGPSAELEMLEALRRLGFPHVPELKGSIGYRRGAEPASLQAILQAYLPNGTEGWSLALTSLRDLYATVEEAEPGSTREHHQLVDEQAGSFEAEAARLGEVTAQLHIAMTDPALPPEMAPLRAGRAELDAWATEMTADLDRLLATGNPATAALAAGREAVAGRFAALRDLGDGGAWLRIHGDYHLGQVLRTDEGWQITDFGGEPARLAGARRQRSSPLRDVAGMLRSFDYAAAVALAERVRPTDAERKRLREAGRAWALANREAFWTAYLERARDAGLLPEAGASLTLRRAFELSKAVYEVEYELGHRPDWVAFPLEFLLRGAR
jgi:trehalose synthase-fused probable maltokinase